MKQRASAGLTSFLGLLLAAMGLPLLGCSDSADGGGASGSAGSGGDAGSAGSGGSGGSSGQSGSGGQAGASGQGGAGCATSAPVEGDESLQICENGLAHRVAGKCTPHQPKPGTKIEDCETDADCDTFEVCSCGTEVNQCVRANCKTDSDCGDGLLCTWYSDPCTWNSGEFGFACQSKADECATKDDCTGAGGGGSAVCVRGSYYRECQFITCGRPFLVEGAERLAPHASRSDWLAPSLAPSLPASPALRATLAQHWTHMALMEHASIAAFARFSLELLALGAPASLVADAASALADEQRHALACFSLASAYAGRPVGPGPLKLDGCVGEVTLERAVETTLLEGCIGETVAALEARAVAEAASDEVVAGVMGEIAEEEGRHAALAWRFVRWALGQRPELGERVRELVERQAEAARREGLAARQGEGGAWLEAGVADGVWRARLRREVLDDVVRPCLRALLGAAPAAEARAS